MECANLNDNLSDNDDDSSSSSLLDSGETPTISASYLEHSNILADNCCCEPANHSSLNLLEEPGDLTSNGPGQSGLPKKRTHISALPLELLLRIFRWVVGSHLDTRMLGVLACVCRGFYRLSNDPCIWRSICQRQWPALFKDQSLPSLDLSQYGYASWRDMAIQKPHLEFGGCYLSRISYVRPGEPEFGSTDRPAHLVVYYRAVRFHSNGCMQMVTSNCATVDELRLMLDSMEANKLNRLANGLLLGTYEWSEPDMITCSLHRARLKDDLTHASKTRRQSSPELVFTFNIKFRLTNSTRHVHSILKWHSYAIHSFNTSTNTEHLTTLKLHAQQFPSFRFSYVRSYLSTMASEAL